MKIFFASKRMMILLSSFHYHFKKNNFLFIHLFIILHLVKLVSSPFQFFFSYFSFTELKSSGLLFVLGILFAFSFMYSCYPFSVRLQFLPVIKINSNVIYSCSNNTHLRAFSISTYKMKFFISSNLLEKFIYILIL